MRAYPLGPRIAAGLGALVVTAYFGILMPRALLHQGYAWSAAALVAATIPLVAFLTLLALSPDALQALLRRGTRIDLRDRGHVGAAIIMAGTLFFVLGYGSLVNGLYAYEHNVVLDRPSDPITGDGILSGLLLNAFVLILPVILYVAYVGGTGARGALTALGLVGPGIGRALLVGAATALAVLIALVAVSAAIAGMQVEVPENDVALEIARSITVLGAIGIATGAALSEEIFFRGFLQPRIGLWGQAILFSLAHLSYVNVLQIVVTLVLGLLFGIIYERTRSLWAPIAAHFVFNLLMLLAGIYAPDPPA